MDLPLVRAAASPAPSRPDIAPHVTRDHITGDENSEGDAGRPPAPPLPRLTSPRTLEIGLETVTRADGRADTPAASRRADLAGRLSLVATP